MTQKNTRKPWLERVKDGWADTKEALVARWHGNKMLLIAGVMMAVCGAVAIGGFYYQGFREHAASQTLMQIQEGTIKQVNDALAAKSIASITRHTIYREASIFDPTLIGIQVFEDKDGKVFRMDASALTEEFWKTVTEAGKEQAFLTKVGEEYPKRNTLLAMAGMGFLYSTLIMVLVFAQMMVGQVVSGHTFKADRRDRDVGLDDIVGYEDVKRDVVEILDKMHNARRYAAAGVKAPRGLLLLGGPGVGKTMLAKAVANEMKGEFFYCTGADFAEMYVGVGPRRVRTLFKLARKAGRAVIFIDEIDAIGARNTMGNDSERQATINQFLAEMDGVNTNGSLLVIGATNHPELLDPALRRPGRFDKELMVPLPDVDTRRGILGRYLEGFGQDETVDLDAMALRTQGYSGALLAGLVAEAKNLALRHAGADQPPVISQATLETAQENQLLGSGQQKSHPDDVRRVAYHELGHALAGLVCRDDIVLEKITISGKGRALGYCVSRPVRDSALRTQANMEGELVMKLAGRAAEEVILGSVSSGAIDDLERATELARDMVGRMGFGRQTGLMVPPRSTDPGHLQVSVQEDIQELLNVMYERAKALVQQHRVWMEHQAAILLGGQVDTLGRDALLLGLEQPGT